MCRALVTRKWAELFIFQRPSWSSSREKQLQPETIDSNIVCSWMLQTDRRQLLQDNRRRTGKSLNCDIYIVIIYNLRLLPHRFTRLTDVWNNDTCDSQI